LQSGTREPSPDRRSVPEIPGPHRPAIGLHRRSCPSAHPLVLRMDQAQTARPSMPADLDIPALLLLLRCTVPPLHQSELALPIDRERTPAHSRLAVRSVLIACPTYGHNGSWSPT